MSELRDRAATVQKFTGDKMPKTKFSKIPVGVLKNTQTS
jgi:hypothetical protein